MPGVVTVTHMSVPVNPPGPIHCQPSPLPAHSIVEPPTSMVVMVHWPKASCVRVAISVHTAIAIRTRLMSDLHRSRLGPGRDEARRGHGCGVICRMGPAPGTREPHPGYLKVPRHACALRDLPHAGDAG